MIATPVVRSIAMNICKRGTIFSGKSSSRESGPATALINASGLDVRFSNRPFGVKHLQAIRRCSVDVTHGLVLLFGIGAKALPSWDSRTRWNNLFRGLTVID
jgi:hypothetical protein